MPSEVTAPLGHDRLNEALAAWERAREQGRPLRRAEFLAEYPDLAEELATCLDAADRVERVASPVRGALVPVPEGYEALEVLGQGGMGVVYRARQTSTGQLVALKLLRPDWLAGLDEAGQRQAALQFRDEARAAARLRHPNRVRIFHLGEHQGRPYYAMELIEGRSLAEKLKAGGVRAVDAVRYLAGVAEAVQEAHDRGIVHRDIKPHNILIDDRTDQALLADFGLARIAPEPADGAVQGGSGQDGRVAGTLPYMPPEQTDPAGTIDARTDVYSIGATLYQALTGTPPFAGRSPEELIRKVRSEPPEPPRRRNPRVNRRLEAICLRCLEKDPARRFASARELADALDRYLDDVRYTRYFAKPGKVGLYLLPVWVVPHLAVFGLLQVRPLPVWLIWPLVFTDSAMRCALFSRTYQDWGRPRDLQGVFSLWLGHLVASIFLAFALGMTFPADPERVVLFMYPVLAALSGMAYLTEASKMPWSLRWGPVGFWLVGVVMLFHLPWAPLYFCAYNAVGTLAYTRYLMKQAEELR